MFGLLFLTLRFIIETIKVAIGIANMKKVTELYFWSFLANSNPVINLRAGIVNQNMISAIQLKDINFKNLFKRLIVNIVAMHHNTQINARACLFLIYPSVNIISNISK